MLSSQVERAKSIATRAHEGQTDKIGAPYIEHPEMVASFVQGLPGFAARVTGSSDGELTVSARDPEAEG